MGLVEIFPNLDAQMLAARFVPPPRFDGVTFDNFVPNAAFPSQGLVRDELATFVEQMKRAPEAKGLLSRFKKTNRTKMDDIVPGRYLDGGFGVGKTHLLASTWYAAPGPKAYMSFEELTAFVGFAGMPAAIETFRNHRLVCIDEFELDDVANTLLVVSFLRGILESEPRTWLCTTSNTVPDSLGEQRFSASEFKREIAAISAHFEELRVDGPDYRSSSAPNSEIREMPALAPNKTEHYVDDFDALLDHLGRVHPVQYSALFDNAASVTVNGLHTIDAQDTALLFVQFVDKLYDARIPVVLNGCATGEVFAPRFRNGGYRKKYGRTESRIDALRNESN